MTPNLELTPKTHLLPNGNSLYLFPSDALELVKLDITVEGGSCYQTKMCLAQAANQLFGEATLEHEAAWVAEFMDFRGITLERMADICTGNVSFYFLRKYAEELLPLVREMFEQPCVTQQLFEAHKAKRRLQLSQNFQKTSYVARNIFYEQLYGPEHVLGTYARPEDVEALTQDDVSAFIHEHYRLGEAHIVLSGSIDEELLSLCDKYLVGEKTQNQESRFVCPQVCDIAPHKVHQPMPNAVQSSLRIGRVLPYTFDDMEYARFMVLNTVLGGYFGSRLMGNLREDKGYTYGIYSQTQIYRGNIVFYIAADVAGEATDKAVEEVLKEMERLRKEPVETEELQRVVHYMEGDFIRSIDGVFERSERYRQMVATDVTEKFTENYHEALQTITPEQLTDIAQLILSPETLTIVTAGMK